MDSNERSGAEMVFRYLGWGSASDPDRQLQLTDVSNLIQDWDPGFELKDLRTVQVWRFPVATERTLVPWTLKDGRTIQQSVKSAVRLPLSKVKPAVAAIADLRRSRGPSLTVDQGLEAVREGVFTCATEGGFRLTFYPDFEVTYL